jgi:hypothetical protein
MAAFSFFPASARSHGLGNGVSIAPTRTWRKYQVALVLMLARYDVWRCIEDGYRNHCRAAFHSGGSVRLNARTLDGRAATSEPKESSP